jgi:hypothetical protein
MKYWVGTSDLYQRGAFPKALLSVLYLAAAAGSSSTFLGLRPRATSDLCVCHLLIMSLSHLFHDSLVTIIPGYLHVCYLAIILISKNCFIGILFIVQNEGFHCDNFTQAYNLLWSYSPPPWFFLISPSSNLLF